MMWVQMAVLVVLIFIAVAALRGYASVTQNRALAEDIYSWRGEI